MNIMTSHLRQRLIWTLFIAVSVALLWSAWQGWLPMTFPEVFGFISGVLTVWLVVKENVWNWPIGIINSAFFIVLFWNARLFADMGLQVVYIVLGVLGWYWWLRGGTGKTELPMSRTNVRTWIWLAGVSTLATYGAMMYLRSIHDAAPFLDAVTTVASLAAQYLLTKKKIENWFIWMAADVIYVGLYLYKDLYLTAVLYVLFFGLCVAGYRSWRRTLMAGAETPVSGGSSHA